jgi:hypothetical protein
MKLFTRIAAVCGLIATLGATMAFAQAPAGKKAVTVHGYTRKAKNGKIITVKSYTRTAGAKKVAKTTVVKGYTRKTKSGKIVTVKSYKRTAVTKMGGMKMGGAPKK